MIVNNKLVSYIPFSILLHLEREGVLDKEETNKYILDDTGTYFPKFKKRKWQNIDVTTKIVVS